MDREFDGVGGPLPFVIFYYICPHFTKVQGSRPPDPLNDSTFEGIEYEDRNGESESN